MLDNVWRRLAEIVDEAQRLQSEAAKDPKLLKDPRVQALDRWLFLFDRELGAVQTVHDAVEAGSKLSSDDMRVAQETGERLLEVVTQPPVVGPTARDESLSSDQVTTGHSAARTAGDESLSSDQVTARTSEEVFVYTAVYSTREDADADYDTLLDLQSSDLVGSTYDVALVYKDDEGNVHVTKREKPTQHGAWTGAGVGALVGIVFPPAIFGAAAGGGIGHALGGMSRKDAKELGDYLDSAQAALVVIGELRLQEQLDKALTRAQKSEEREINADAKELAKELNALPS